MCGGVLVFNDSRRLRVHACVVKNKLPTENVLGRSTLAEGAIQRMFAYGVGPPLVGLIPSPRLGGYCRDCPRLFSKYL